jgi:hypothetical protein
MLKNQHHDGNRDEDDRDSHGQRQPAAFLRLGGRGEFEFGVSAHERNSTPVTEGISSHPPFRLIGLRFIGIGRYEVQCHNFAGIRIIVEYPGRACGV